MQYKKLGAKFLNFSGHPMQIVGLVFTPRSELYRVLNLFTGKECDLNATEVKKMLRSQQNIRKQYFNKIPV